MTAIQTGAGIVQLTMSCDARSSNGTPLFRHSCPDCGAVRLGDKRKKGLSCPACAAKRRATHGLSKHPLYRKLTNIRVRCEYPSASGYADYGARGISVCDEWKHDPQAFVDWCMANGYRPELEIDRIDNDGPYAPWNCRFVTHLVNSQHTRRTKLDEVTADRVRLALHGYTGSLRALARSMGLPHMAVWHVSKNHCWKAAA